MIKLLRDLGFVLLGTVLTIAILIAFSHVIQTTDEFVNYVEFQAKYRNYTLVEKSASDTAYVFVLKNPLTNKIVKQEVSSTLYLQMYFVGDTIK